MLCCSFSQNLESRESERESASQAQCESQGQPLRQQGAWHAGHDKVHPFTCSVTHCVSRAHFRCARQELE